MQINCPKCGFRQPDDAYCAQCGVNLVAARRRWSFAVTRVWKSAWLRLGLSLVVAALVLLQLMALVREEPTAPGGLTIPQPVAAPSGDRRQPETRSAIPAAMPALPAANRVTEVAAATKELPTALIEKLQITLAIATPDTLTELDRAELVEVAAADARALVMEKDGEVSLSGLRDGEAVVELDGPRLVTIAGKMGTERIRILENQPGGQTIGLDLDVEAERIATGVRVHVSGSAALPLKTGGMGRRNVDMTVDLAPHQALILTEVLPANAAPLTPKLAPLLSAPLRAIATDDERAKSGELMILITPNP
jgi:hypothetical protein